MKKLLLFALLISGMANAQKGQAITERGGDYGDDWIEVSYFDFNGSSYSSARSEDIGAGCYINLPSDPTSFASLHKVSNTLIIETTDMATSTFSIVGNSFSSSFSEPVNLLYKRNASGQYRGAPSSDYTALNLDQNCAIGGFVNQNAPTETSTETSSTPTGTITQNILAGNDIRITDFFGPHAVDNEIVNTWRHVRSEQLSALEYNTLIRASGGAESLYVPFPSTEDYSVITYQNTFYGITTDIVFHVRLLDNSLFRVSHQDNLIGSEISYAIHNLSDHPSISSLYYMITANTYGTRYVYSLNNMISSSLLFTEEVIPQRNNQNYTSRTLKPVFDFGGRSWRFIRYGHHPESYVNNYHYYDGENTLVIAVSSRNNHVEIRGLSVNNMGVPGGYELYVYIQENF